MRFILALIAMLTAGTAFGTVTVPRTELKAEDFARLGIVLTAVDANVSRLSMHFPVVVTLNLDSFTECSVRNVYVSFVDEYEILMAGASVAPSSRGFAFQVRPEFFATSRLTFSCEGALLEYRINVGRDVPVVSILDR